MSRLSGTKTHKRNVKGGACGRGTVPLLQQQLKEPASHTRLSKPKCVLNPMSRRIWETINQTPVHTIRKYEHEEQVYALVQPM